MTPTPDASTLIRAERRRQVQEEGWDLVHDLEHGSGALAAAAECYATAGPRADVPSPWPWDACWFKPKGAVRNLVRAGALYMAAVDVAARLDPGAIPELRDRLEAVTAHLDLTLAEAAQTQ